MNPPMPIAAFVISIFTGESMRIWVLLLLFCVVANPATALEEYLIPMHSQGTHTFYIDSQIHGAGEYSMLVDTGSGYSVINEETLQLLMANGQAKYVSKLRGKMADGSERIIPLYRIAAITLGKNCVIRNIKAAVMPNNARQIIGISTLMQAAPFSMSFNPPLLSLSQCSSSHQQALVQPAGH